MQQPEADRQQVFKRTWSAVLCWLGQRVLYIHYCSEGSQTLKINFRSFEFNSRSCDITPSSFRSIRTHLKPIKVIFKSCCAFRDQLRLLWKSIGAHARLIWVATIFCDSGEKVAQLAGSFFSNHFFWNYTFFFEMLIFSTQLAGRFFFKIPEIPNSNFQKCWFSRPS